MPAPGPLDRLNRLPAGEAERALLACCGSTRWARLVAAARPFESEAAVTAVADAALSALDWSDVEQALAGHPRLGEQPASTAAGADRAGQWSRSEQSGVAAADADIRAALAAGNAAYERRFGHVYLACAAGRGGAELLALLHDRLGNDPPTEREVVRAELAKITRLRLAKLLTAPDMSERGALDGCSARGTRAGPPGGAERERGATTAVGREGRAPHSRTERTQ